MVGYQTAQISQEKMLKEGINQKELLFDFILDIAKNQEIQNAILTYQYTNCDALTFPPRPVISKAQLTSQYSLRKTLTTLSNVTAIPSVKQYKSTSALQYRLINIIENNSELSQVMNFFKTEGCCCRETMDFPHPIICGILFLLVLPILGPAVVLKAIIESLLDSNRILLANMLFLFDIPFIIMCAVLITLVFAFNCEI